MTTHSLVWAQLDVVVPAFTGSTTVAVPVACNYDLEVAAAKYLHALPDGEAPLALHFNGMVYYPNDDGGLQMVADPVVALDRLPHAGLGLARDDRALLPEHRLGGRCARETLRGARARAASTAASPTYDACVAALLERRAMPDALEQLIDSLLYEGYALYPYTPGRPRTPRRPRSGSSTRRSMRRRWRAPSTTSSCAAGCRRRADAVISAEARFLAADGERHQAVARRLALGRARRWRARCRAARRRRARAATRSGARRWTSR